jgi:hypothetical protein
MVITFVQPLPNDVFEIILSYTEPRDRKSILLTSKQFYKIGRKLFPPPIQVSLPPPPDPLPVCFNCQSVTQIISDSVNSLLLTDYGNLQPKWLLLMNYRRNE